MVSARRYHKEFMSSKTCNIPYISETALRSVKFIRKILPPQHIGVNPFSTYPVSEKEFVQIVHGQRRDVYVGDIQTIGTGQNGVVPMTYSTSRFAPLNDDIPLFALLDLDSSYIRR
jgi:hypothetical protein